MKFQGLLLSNYRLVTGVCFVNNSVRLSSSHLWSAAPFLKHRQCRMSFTWRNIWILTRLDSPFATFREILQQRKSELYFVQLSTSHFSCTAMVQQRAVSRIHSTNLTNLLSPTGPLSGNFDLKNGRIRSRVEHSLHAYAEFHSEFILV